MKWILRSLVKAFLILLVFWLVVFVMSIIWYGDLTIPSFKFRQVIVVFSTLFIVAFYFFKLDTLIDFW